MYYMNGLSINALSSLNITIAIIIHTYMRNILLLCVLGTTVLHIYVNVYTYVHNYTRIGRIQFKLLTDITRSEYNDHLHCAYVTLTL